MRRVCCGNVGRETREEMARAEPNPGGGGGASVAAGMRTASGLQTRDTSVKYGRPGVAAVPRSKQCGHKEGGGREPGQHLLKDATQSLSRGDSSATPGPHGAHKQQSRLGVTVKRGEDSCSGTGGAALAFSCFLPAPVPETLTPRRKGWR